MSVGRSGQPGADEQIPYFTQYIRLVPAGDLLKILTDQIGVTQQTLAPLTAEAAGWRKAPNEWNATEIVGHLADTERVLGDRLFRLARGDDTPPAGVEFEEYAAEAAYAERSLSAVVAEFATVRAATVALLQGLPLAAWERRAPELWTCRTVRSFGYIIAGHERYHLADIERQQALRQQ